MTPEIDKKLRAGHMECPACHKKSMGYAFVGQRGFGGFRSHDAAVCRYCRKRVKIRYDEIKQISRKPLDTDFEIK